LKYDPSVSKWYNGGSKVAKERIGIAFRDALQPNKVKCMDTMKSFINDNDLMELPLSTSMTLLSKLNTTPPLHPSNRSPVKAVPHQTVCSQYFAIFAELQFLNPLAFFTCFIL
jgi:hypothetical protein